MDDIEASAESPPPPAVRVALAVTRRYADQQEVGRSQRVRCESFKSVPRKEGTGLVRAESGPLFSVLCESIDDSNF